MLELDDASVDGSGANGHNMANTPKRHPSGRRKKETRTIDLEANPNPEKSGTPDASVSDKNDVADAARPIAGKVEAESPAEKKEAMNTGETLDTGKSGKADSKPLPKTSKPASKDEHHSETHKAAKSGTSVLSMLVSSLIGGAVVLGGVGALNSTGNLQGLPVIGGLFGDNDASGSASADLDAANAKIAELSARLDELAASFSGGTSGEIAQLSEKISAVEARIAEGGGDGSGETAQIAEKALAVAEAASQKADDTSNMITELSDKIVESGGGATVDMEALKAALSSESDALAGRIAAVEGKLADGGGAMSPGELETIREQLKGLDQLTASVSAIDGKTDSIAQGLKEAGETIATVNERLGALEASVNDTILPSMGEVEKAAAAAIESQKVARSVSARALGNVLEQGGKFTSELAAAEALAGSSEAISGLKPLAASGISTNGELLSGFEAVSDQILSAESGKAEGDGILDKFMASARTLVQVRPSGPVSGDSTGAVLSRIKASLEAGDLEAAKTEWASLNDAAKAASADWMRSLDDRIRARALIDSVIDDLSTERNDQQKSQG